MGPPPRPHSSHVKKEIPPDQQKMIRTHDSQIVAESEYKEEWHKPEYKTLGSGDTGSTEGYLHPQDVSAMVREIHQLKQVNEQLKAQANAGSSTVRHEERRWHPSDSSKAYTWEEFKIEAESQLRDEEWWNKNGIFTDDAIYQRALGMWKDSALAVYPPHTHSNKSHYKDYNAGW